jgi:hypothetical protein
MSDNKKKKKLDSKYVSKQKFEQTYEKKRVKPYKKWNKETKSYMTVVPKVR